ncbi:phosphotransferase enzyme family protein [Aspergillus niger]|uniref:Altered inheritance of mitochondria protein 9, mitochondrial n=1 Tax=Aspergillus niger TaxID=5061 RepID=A0A100IBR4_ASPNG|nr:phosphotransferase enzyme family protein [Aspergillus niger]
MRKARGDLRMYHIPTSYDHSTATDIGRHDRNGVLLDIDPHNYTSGRWLRNDDEERASRYIQFDFDALCRKVLALSPGASTITGGQKLEGGFNRVFIFELDNDKRVVARLPFSLAGPAQLTTSSEIATIEYLQANTTVPIPKILDWSNDATSIDNPIGSEYIIMEHATGVQLHKKWHEMDGNDLYEYCDGLIDAGLSRLPAVDLEMKRRPMYHGSVETHKMLLAQTRDLMRCMSQDSRIMDCATPVLFHPDLHKRNIFVLEDDPSEITAIIDWQAASIEPAFCYADEIPDFATENEDGAAALHHDLIDTSQNWEKLGFAGPCPYAVPPPHELADHQRKYRLFEAAHNLRYDLAGLLNTATDGWVPTGDWEAAQTAHHEMFDGMLQAVLTNPEIDDPDEPVKDEETLRAIWPFDI